MKILHLEDSPFDAEIVGRALAAEFPGCSVVTVDTQPEFLSGIANSPDLILSDFSLPTFSGLEALALATARTPDIPFVFLSGTIGEERAAAAVRAGAYDYVLKDNLTRLSLVIRRALDDFARRRFSAANQRRLLQLAGVIERAGEAIVVTDMDGHITLWNDGAARLYGLTAAETVGRTSEEVFPNKEMTQVRIAREATLDAGEWQRELSVTTRDGRNIVVDVRMTLVRDSSGCPQARLTIANDITERKRFEEQFLRAQRVESLGMIAAGIAHDFSNILAPFGMVASLLRSRATEPRDIQMLEILERNAERGAGLVRQILGFARGANGSFQVTEIGPLLGDVGDIIRASFPPSIEFEEQIPGDLWPILANQTQIHQILLNLAINARDALMPGGGKLIFRAENRSIDESAAGAIEGGRAGDFLALEVADTGSGIPPEVLARIWDPFFTTKGEGKGTGLGLSAVRGIAAAHRGFVTVETQLGQGTAFRIFLPAVRSAGPEFVD